MSDHLVLYVDRLVRPVPVQPVESEAGPSTGIAGPSCSADDKEKEVARFAQPCWCGNGPFHPSEPLVPLTGKNELLLGHHFT
ncbi:hypothetical protein CCACVL1_13943 [Corchorus capsularis]|uniref:Uncharacterized protein n=1 Tax=Corchorus capsularis TaxID=210143 RepID=A0A1R3I908_COCAP|nr:hypothetical protein CCACVL1_13943 [Corchorus capsularis]